MNLLYKLGQTPTRSFSYFLAGLVLFAIGLGLIYFITESSQYLQLFALALVGLGCLLAIWGYIGIFSSRMLAMMNRHPKTKK
jgi:sulfite exporter TauE/SafE